MVNIYKKSNPPQVLSTHFTTKEFLCPCDTCKEILIDSDLVTYLEDLRESLGTPLKITSGYRCSSYQAELKLRGYDTALGVSQHELGKAADITNGVALGHELEDLARKAGFSSVGVGKNWVHVDLRPGYRRWTYAR